jgi:hypothetical protein
MTRHSSSPLAIFAVFLPLLCLCAPASALSQGKCGYLAGGNPGPWVSVEGGGGFALPIPLSGSMGAKSLVAGFAGGVQLHLPRRVGVGIVYLNKEFRERDSTFEYGKFHDLLARGSLADRIENCRDEAHDLLARGSLAVVLSQRVQWDFHLLLGLSSVTVQFIDIDKLKTVTQNGMVELVGQIKRKQIITFTGGLGTRLAWFPIDLLGIYLDVSVLYAYQASLEPEDGAMNLNTVSGLEIHF